MPCHHPSRRHVRYLPLPDWFIAHHCYSHGFLDNLKAPIELVNYRATYYKFCVTEILKAVGVPTDKLEFVLGSSYQKSPE